MTSKFFAIYRLTDEEDKEQYQKFKESQKAKHCSIWGARDLEDAFIAGMEWQKMKENK